MLLNILRYRIISVNSTTLYTYLILLAVLLVPMHLHSGKYPYKLSQRTIIIDICYLPGPMLHRSRDESASVTAWSFSHGGSRSTTKQYATAVVTCMLSSVVPTSKLPRF